MQPYGSETGRGADGRAGGKDHRHVPRRGGSAVVGFDEPTTSAARSTEMNELREAGVEVPAWTGSSTSNCIAGPTPPSRLKLANHLAESRLRSIEMLGADHRPRLDTISELRGVSTRRLVCSTSSTTSFRDRRFPRSTRTPARSTRPSRRPATGAGRGPSIAPLDATGMDDPAIVFNPREHDTRGSWTWTGASVPSIDSVGSARLVDAHSTVPGWRWSRTG